MTPRPAPAVAALALLAAMLPGGGALAQAAAVTPFGTPADTGAPVEVTAEKLQVSQKDDSATFSGNVLIVQGEMRLSAQEVRVIYAGTDRRRISSFDATGGVTMVSGRDAGEAKQAHYDVATGVITLTGDAMVVRDGNALSGERMVIDLASGNAEVQGGVRSVLTPGAR